jgi:hypothetical protein
VLARALERSLFWIFRDIRIFRIYVLTYLEIESPTEGLGFLAPRSIPSYPITGYLVPLRKSRVGIDRELVREDDVGPSPRPVSSICPPI